MKNSMAIAYAMKRKASKMAQGGQVAGSAAQEGEDGDTDEDELIDRIMARRMSEGGKVANSTTVMADELPAEYDDLVLRDDLEGGYTGANSGDEIGNEQEDKDRSDLVSRIMKSRALKDRLHSPR